MTTIWIILILNTIMIAVVYATRDEIEVETNGWNFNPHTQYHIQTDEGPERYFRFQTLNGQFRKEKRLEDGTVIGTEGWLDPLGFLRIKDYIADGNGYRILRSKKIFVGKNEPIGDAVAISQRFPTQTGILVQSRRRPVNPFRQASYAEMSDNSIEGNIAIKPTKRYPGSVQPMTVLSPIMADKKSNAWSQPSKNYNPSQMSRAYIHDNPHYTYSQLPEPSLGMKPPLSNYRNIFNQPIAITSRSKEKANTRTTDTHQERVNQFNNNNDNNKNTSILTEKSSQIQTGEEFPQYDGTHTLSDGFQYYLKKQYHEEEEKLNNRVGSFGYIDPFGIRRVIYYKTDGSNGFLHKKNNRYVGLTGTPFDPVPILK
ncbi:uncharacterized protein LOC135161503 isoform X2 [Diachasmimorpha longicaudata]|uniref:uncharacterized protein LOC135161503 isoform X2 n=1 Tax=Diachasmimorpha longicaudata TaxID=58733 RepID=UPI0030B8EAC3